MQTKNTLGTVISGSLQEGFSLRLFPETPMETVRTGKFVCIQGINYRFFSLITDVRLTVSHPDILLFPPSPEERLLTKILVQRDMYAVANIRPLVTVDQHNRVAPVTTIPNHFAPVTAATSDDIATIFGSEDDTSRSYFSIGTPLDMKASLCVDLEKIGERSTGIFGKTGTGKTFITRLMLAGIMHKKTAACLIFDMHSEYGFQARKEGEGQAFVKGLKTLFPQQIVIFSLDPAATRRRGLSPDHAIDIAYQTVHVEDIISLQHELNLHPTAFEAAHLLSAKYKNQWLAILLSQGENLKELAAQIGAHPESLAALYRKLRQVERLPFLYNETTAPTRHDMIDDMISYIDRGISIIIEFGNYSSTFCYLLVANIITRRIHALYTAKTEAFLATGRAHDEPQQLIIVIEEAHTFLHTAAARQTTFGVIAREMRKYYVSLLIVDQRPSGIDAEIMSQIGTKLVAQLNDEKDIQAVLSGTSQAPYLRSLLAALSSKQQLLIIGHAIVMPMIVETRPYDEAFYRAILTRAQQPPTAKLINELYEG